MTWQVPLQDWCEHPGPRDGTGGQQLTSIWTGPCPWTQDSCCHLEPGAAGPLFPFPGRAWLEVGSPAWGREPLSLPASAQLLLGISHLCWVRTKRGASGLEAELVWSGVGEGSAVAGCCIPVDCTPCFREACHRQPGALEQCGGDAEEATEPQGGWRGRAAGPAGMMTGTLGHGCYYCSYCPWIWMCHCWELFWVSGTFCGEARLMCE